MGQIGAGHQQGRASGKGFHQCLSQELGVFQGTASRPRCLPDHDRHDPRFRTDGLDKGYLVFHRVFHLEGFAVELDPLVGGDKGLRHLCVHRDGAQRRIKASGCPDSDLC